MSMQNMLNQVVADSKWQNIDFISDTHLQHMNGTAQVFLRYIQNTPAQAIFLLGDIFEIWVGDDVLTEQPASLAHTVLAALAQAAARGVCLYFMHGNRDFLLGQQAAAQVPFTLLDDPCVLHIPQATAAWQRVLLSHGDALCLDDKPYQQFRALVRQAMWQQQFLQQPLAQRLHMAQHIRSESEMRKQVQGLAAYADVDAAYAQQMLMQHGCTQLVHGHTHRPGSHILAQTPQLLQRHVLTDWDMEASPVREGGLRLHSMDGYWYISPFSVMDMDR